MAVARYLSFRCAAAICSELLMPMAKFPSHSGHALTPEGQMGGKRGKEHRKILEKIREMPLFNMCGFYGIHAHIFCQDFNASIGQAVTIKWLPLLWPKSGCLAPSNKPRHNALLFVAFIKCQSPFPLHSLTNYV
jgi:hypothetical protein